MNAVERMSHALIELTDQGLRPACGAATDERNDWTSDDPGDRACAALACRPCPLVELCRDFASEIKATHGVWAGTDLSTTTRQTRGKTA